MEKREGYKKTKIGWVPVEWDVVDFKDIVELNKKKVVPTKNGNEKCVELEHIQQRTGRLLGYSMANGKSSTKTPFKSGNILFGKLRPNLMKYCLPDFDGVCSTEVFVFKAKVNIDNRFVFSIVQTDGFINNTVSKSFGTKMPRTNWKIVGGYPLPLPPLPEQQKIASILTTVDDKILSIEHQIQQTEQLKKGLMEKLLTEGIGHTEFKDTKIGKIPKGWGDIRLSEIGSLQGGYAFKSKLFNDDGNGYQVVRMSNVQPFGLYLEKTPVFMAELDDKMEPFILNAGDILITLTGTIGKTDYGNVAIIKSDKKLLLNQRVARFVLSDDAHNEFIYYVFRFKHFRNRFFSFGKGGTGNQANVGKQDFESIPIPLPPIEEQKQIAAILSTVDDKIDILNQKKAQYQTLKKGLSQQLLTGQMRVKI